MKIFILAIVFCAIQGNYGRQPPPLTDMEPTDPHGVRPSQQPSSVSSDEVLVYLIQTVQYLQSLLELLRSTHPNVMLSMPNTYQNQNQEPDPYENNRLIYKQTNPSNPSNPRQYRPDSHDKPLILFSTSPEGSEPPPDLAPPTRWSRQRLQSLYRRG